MSKRLDYNELAPAGIKALGAVYGNHGVILPMSGKKLRSSTAGIRFTDGECGGNTASSEPTVR